MGKRYTINEIKDFIKKNNTDKFYMSREWEKLANQIRLEQHNECQVCKKLGKYHKAEIVHHVNFLKDRPDLAYSKIYTDKDGNEQLNLICVCFDCHERIHNRGKYAEHKINEYFTKERW